MRMGRNNNSMKPSPELALHILAHMPDALITTDAQGCITSWNPAAERIYGWPARDVLGAELEVLLETDFFPLQGHEHVRSQLRSQGWWRGYVLQVAHNGTLLRIHSTASLLHDASGVACGTMVLNRIVADGAHLSAQTIEALVEGLMITSGDGLWKWDVTNNWLRFSSQMQELLAYPSEKRLELNQSMMQLIHPDDFDRLAQSLNQHLEQHQPLHCEVRMHVGSNQDCYRWFLIRGQARWDAQGYPTTMIGTLTAIDYLQLNHAELEDYNRNLEARAAENSSKLQYSLQLVASINAATPDFLYTYNLAERRFVYTNRSLLSFLGYDGGQTEVLTGQVLTALTHHDDVIKLQEHLDSMSAIADDLIVEFEYRLRNAQNQWCWLYCRELVFQRSADGQVMVILGVASDITVRKQTEADLRHAYNDLSAANAQLARANRLKDEFLANMSHELRTPLNAIIGRTESLREGLYGTLDPSQHTALATIEESGRHLLELITDILDLSKIEADRLYFEIQQVSIPDLCDACQRLVSLTAEQRNLTLSVSLDPQLPAVYSDGRRLRQILLNLLANAIKFTPAGGEVTLAVTWQPTEEQIHFQVEDSGIGIAADKIDQLFQPFVQIDSGLQRQFPGTGLGLALVARLVERLGGSIRVRSAPGEGSCFNVALPATNSAAQHSATPAPRNGLRILLADNHAAYPANPDHELSALGYQVRLVHDGEECLRAALANPPDLIVLDLQLRRLAGVALIQRLRASPELAAVPLIALTALDRPHDEALCRAAGASAYLHKPVAPHILHQLIARMLHL
ncbi:MAG: PAS domain-containing protein [Candidatus Viridilinea halotolerans]|uniref:Circadian input-output histidine kinase CikA n=1 Tax=Candidatus Viridilinea halotolerans TaxID=2491704 RepID=A0A426U337_9CHLR|nr:MAG: PAS domain-containing protein [Candidatus Viridilinea halotolerans]